MKTLINKTTRSSFYATGSKSGNLIAGRHFSGGSRNNPTVWVKANDYVSMETAKLQGLIK